MWRTTTSPPSSARRARAVPAFFLRVGCKLYSRTQFFDMRLSGMQAPEGLCSSEHAWPGTARRPARRPPSCARESRALRLTTGQGLLQDPRPTAVRGNPSSSPAQGCVELAPRPPRQLHTKCTHGAGSRSTLPPSCARESRALRLTAGQGLLQDPRPTAVRGNPSSSPAQSCVWSSNQDLLASCTRSARTGRARSTLG